MDSPANASFRLCSVFEPFSLLMTSPRGVGLGGQCGAAWRSRPAEPSAAAAFVEIDCAYQDDRFGLSRRGLVDVAVATAGVTASCGSSRPFGSSRNSPASCLRKPPIAELLR